MGAQAAAANAESADAGKPASMMADADAATQAASAEVNGAAAAAATNAAGSTRMQDDGTSGLRPAVAEDDNIRQDSVGAGALDTDAERSTISISNSSPKSTLPTENSFSVKTPNSVFTFGDSNSQLTK